MKKAYLAPDILVGLVIDKNYSLEDLKAKQEIRLVTSALGFYEMMSSLTAEEIKEYAETIYDIFKSIGIIDFGEEIRFQSPSRIKHLRNFALSKKDEK